jgi:thioesterase domain-containing protein
MAKTELQQALDTIKKHCEKPKGKSFHEHMDNASLKQRIETLQSNFLLYVDHQTIWYSHKKHYEEMVKKDPKNQKEYWEDLIDHSNYTDVVLSEKQRKDCIQALGWLLNDVKACIAHLEK